MKIILASASPRRRELLAQIGVSFEVMVSDVEEKITTTLPYQVVEELSLQKAEAVWTELKFRSENIRDGIENVVDGEEVLVIGADTVVACDNKILGKPKDREDAVRMLQMLSGRVHEVYTGVTLLFQRETGDIEKKSFYEMTKVQFYSMTKAEIVEYVNTKDPMDKAGAYGIQGFCARYIQGIEGDYNNVVGLPVGRLYQEIRRLVSWDYCCL